MAIESYIEWEIAIRLCRWWMIQTFQWMTSTLFEWNDPKPQKTSSGHSMMSVDWHPEQHNTSSQHHMMSDRMKW